MKSIVAARLLAVVSVLLLVAIGINQAWCQGKAAAPDSAAAMQASYKEMEAKLVAQLRDPAAWTEDKQKEKTHKLVETAGVIRSEAAIPVLVEHLTWSDYDQSGFGPFMSGKDVCPAMRSLVQIGLPAVPALIGVIGGPSPDRSTKEEVEARSKMAMMCLFDMYEVGGHGREAALQRIALEVGSSTGEKKERLQRALKLFEDKPVTK